MWVNITEPGTYVCDARVYHVKHDGDNDAWVNLMSTPKGASRFGSWTRYGLVCTVGWDKYDNGAWALQG